MLVSTPKPAAEILSALAGETAVFVLGCNGCAEACKTGGPEHVEQLRRDLVEHGKVVSGSAVVDFLCEKALVAFRLAPQAAALAAADSVVVASCGVGVQVAAAVLEKRCHPAANTVSTGGEPGLWRGPERCGQCGNCLLSYTGGICPVTSCTKSLLNGPCGGSREGRCEFEPDARPCGWIRIYERLKALGRTDLMLDVPGIRDYSRSQPPRAYRSTALWDLEQPPGKVPAAGEEVRR